MEEGVWFLSADAGSFVAWQHRIRPLNVSHPIWAALECGGGRHVTPFLCISNNERKRVSKSFDVIRFYLGENLLTQSLRRQWHGARVASKHSACQRLTAVKNRHSTLLNRISTSLTIFGRKHFRESPQTLSVVSQNFSPQQEPGELPDPQRPLVVRGQNSQMEGGGSTFHVDKRLDFSQGCLWSCFFSHGS